MVWRSSCAGLDLGQDWVKGYLHGCVFFSVWSCAFFVHVVLLLKCFTCSSIILRFGMVFVFAFAFNCRWPKDWTNEWFCLDVWFVCTPICAWLQLVWCSLCACMRPLVQISHFANLAGDWGDFTFCWSLIVVKKGMKDGTCDRHVLEINCNKIALIVGGCNTITLTVIAKLHSAAEFLPGTILVSADAHWTQQLALDDQPFLNVFDFLDKFWHDRNWGRLHAHILKVVPKAVRLSYSAFWVKWL